MLFGLLLHSLNEDGRQHWALVIFSVDNMHVQQKSKKKLVEKSVITGASEVEGTACHILRHRSS